VARKTFPLPSTAMGWAGMVIMLPRFLLNHADHYDL
jgi:hypothetical protein